MYSESAAERQERLKADRKRDLAKLSQESREEREKRLKIIRDNKASRRALETTEQREKRLGTDRKQAALKRASETGQERERRLRAMRELAAKKRATESSQEKELRLSARRERAAVKRHSENRSETVETGRRNETRKAAASAMSREEDHKTLQEECKDAKEAFLRRRKIGRERRVHESAAERQKRLKADRKRVFAKLSQESREEREKRLKVLRDNNAARRAVTTQVSSWTEDIESRDNNHLFIIMHCKAVMTRIFHSWYGEIFINFGISTFTMNLGLPWRRTFVCKWKT